MRVSWQGEAIARYVKLGPDVSCLVSKDNFFMGAIVTSDNTDEPWAFAVNETGKKLLELRAGEHQGQQISSLFDRCEHALLKQLVEPPPALPLPEQKGQERSPRAGKHGPSASQAPQEQSTG